MTGGEAQTPCRAGATATDLHDYARKNGQIEFITAVHFRLQNAIESCFAKPLVHFDGARATDFALSLLFEQQRPQRYGAPDDLVRRQAGFRLGQIRLLFDHSVNKCRHSVVTPSNWLA